MLMDIGLKSGQKVIKVNIEIDIYIKKHMFLALNFPWTLNIPLIFNCDVWNAKKRQSKTQLLFGIKCYRSVEDMHTFEIWYA